MLLFRYYSTFYKIFYYFCIYLLLIMCQHGWQDKQNKGYVG